MGDRRNTERIRWFLGELDGLVERQVIPRETSTALRSHYDGVLSRPASPPAQAGSLTMLILAALGALLIGGGIILLFAYNWDSFSHELRAGIALGPALAGLALTAWVLIKEKSRAWREFAGVWLMVSAYSSMGIIWQTYNLGGHFWKFMTAVVLMTLLVPLITRSTGAVILQLIGTVVFGFSLIETFCWQSSDNHFIFIWGAALLGPLLYFSFTRREKTRVELIVDAVITALAFAFLYLQTIFLLGEIISLQHSEYFILPSILFGGVFALLAGEYLKKTQGNLCSWPWCFVGWVGVIITFSLFQLKDYHEHFILEEPVLAVHAIVAALLLIYGYFCWKKSRLLELWICCMPALMVFTTLIAQTPLVQHYIPPAALASLVIGILGYIGIHLGIKEGSLTILNGSLALLLSAILIRFFDGDFSTLARGIAFIICGILLLGVNFLALKKNARKLKGEDNA